MINVSDPAGTANAPAAPAAAAATEWTQLGDTPGAISANLSVQGNGAGTALVFGQNLTTTGSPTFAGATVNGSITVTGTVDGIDIGTDVPLNTTHRTSDGKDHSDVVLNNAKVTNATHTGDATGDSALTLATVNSNIGSFTNADVTVNEKGLVTAVSNGTSSGGDVVGPLSSTDNAITRFDGITGKLVQDSNVLIDDSNNITGGNDISVSGRLLVSDLGGIRFGPGANPTDLLISHGGLDATITSTLGDLALSTTEVGADILLETNGGSVGINTTLPPNDSAILDMESTTKGFLTPRMTTAQRDLIASPATGLVIYNLSTLEIETYNGSFWTTSSGDGDVIGPGSSAIGSVPTFDTTTGKSIQDPATIFAVGESVGIGTNAPSSALQVVGNLSDQIPGTIDTVTGNTLMSGLGTAFNSDLEVGQSIKVNSTVFVVSIISSDTVLFVTVAPTFTRFDDEIFINSNVINITNSTGSQFNIDASGAVSIGTDTPVSTALLQMDSTTRGLLMPRMTTVERDAISSPATGLEIYNTTNNDLEFYNGSAWVTGTGADPGGLPFELQFNSAGTFGGTSGLTFRPDVDGDLHLATTVNLHLGSGDDLSIGGGSNAFLSNSSGNFTLTNTSGANGDIIIDNQSTTKDIFVRLGSDIGDTALVIQNNSLAPIAVFGADGNINFETSLLLFGTGADDMGIQHNGTFGALENITGDLHLTTTSGNLLVRNSNETGLIRTQLGTADDFTAFIVEDVTTSTLFTVQGDNHVGIGIGNPSTILHIKEDTNTPSVIFCQNSTIGLNASCGLQLASGTGSFLTTAYNSGYLTVGARMANSGVILTSVNMTAGLNIVAEAPNAPVRVYAGDGTTVRMTVDENRVMIGNSPIPSAKLHVYENNALTDSGLIIEQDGTGDALLQFLLTGEQRWVMGVDNTDAHKFKFSATAGLDATTLMTIDTTGNVGIGATSPVTKLHVVRGVSGASPVADTILTVENNANALISILSPDANERGISFGEPTSSFAGLLQYNNSQVLDGFRFQVNGGGASLSLDRNGRAGMGVNSPVSVMHLFENTFSTDATSGLTIEQAGTGDALAHFKTPNGSWTMGIDNDVANKFKIGDGSDLTNTAVTIIRTTGEVGIGTDTPEGRLHVFDGESGAITPVGSQLVIESDGATRLTLLSPALGTTEIAFGNPDSGIGGQIIYDESFLPDGFLFRVDNNVDAIAIRNDGNVGIKSLNPKSTLHVVDNSSATDDTIGLTVQQIASGDAIIRIENTNAVFSMGVDTSDNDNFKISEGTALAVNTAMTISPITSHVAMGTTPVSGAVLSLGSTTAGFLQPNMTEAQIRAINPVPNGLHAHDLTNNLPRYNDGTRWRAGGDPTNVISITSQGDWDQLVIGNTITITSNTTLLLKTFIVTSADILINTGIDFSLLGGDIAGAGLLYVGASTFIVSDGVNVLRMFGIGFLSGNGTGTLFNITNGGQFFRVANMGIFNWSGGLGSVASSNVFEILNAGVFDSEAKFVLDDVSNIAIDGATFTNAGNSVNDALVEIKSSTFSDISATITLASSELQPGEELLLIDTSIGVNSLININTVSLSGDNKDLFQTDNGKSGIFDSVIDETITAGVINTTTDVGGFARFNFTGGSEVVFVGQIISQLTLSTIYDGTFRITAAGPTYYETGQAFISAGNGTFTSDRVTLVDPATTAADGDIIVVDTTLATDYHGRYEVYNKQVGTFLINAAFTTAAHNGTWTTNGLDQKNPDVLQHLSPGLPSSKYIAVGYINSNTTVTTIIASNAYQDMDFGFNLLQGTTTQRWKLINNNVGEFEYIGNEPFDGTITYDITGFSSGGALDFHFKWEISTDGGSSFVDLPDNIIAGVEIGSEESSVSKHIPLQAVNGNIIRPQVNRPSGASDITISFFSCNIFAVE